MGVQISTGAPLEAGIWIEDKDPRAERRRGEITSLNETHARVRWSSGRSTMVRIDRIGRCYENIGKNPTPLLPTQQVDPTLDEEHSRTRRVP